MNSTPANPQALNSSFAACDFDPSLYLVINPEQCRGGHPVELVQQAAAGGVSTIQLRSKTMNDRNYGTLVSEIAEVLHPFQVPVFVNDRVEVALATGVGCIHLGQRDTSVSAARQALGSKARIGLTIRSLEEAKNAPLDELDYVSIGGVFATRSKLDAGAPIGLERLAAICQALRSRNAGCPIIAISGINLNNLKSVLTAGVDGIAVVSAICESSDPESMARRFRKAIDEYNEQGN